MKKNNILILSAGRRVELVQDFQTEAARFSDGIGVFATDLNPHMSSACHVADRAFSVPRIDAAEYIDSIFELAQQHNIGPDCADHRYRTAQAGRSTRPF